MYYLTNCPSPVGKITLASDGENIVGLWIEGQKYFRDSVAGNIMEKDSLPVFGKAKEWLNRYFAGGRPAIKELPLCPAGSEFRQAVWRILCEIPYGEVTTYGKIADKIAVQMGKPRMSGQAVGGAVGHNPISIIIPCHRVVGSSGSLTGYAGGIDVKIKLLKLENADLSHLFVPENGTAL